MYLCFLPGQYLCLRLKRFDLLITALPVRKKTRSYRKRIIKPTTYTVKNYKKNEINVSEGFTMNIALKGNNEQTLRWMLRDLDRSFTRKQFYPYNLSILSYIGKDQDGNLKFIAFIPDEIDVDRFLPNRKNYFLDNSCMINLSKGQADRLGLEDEYIDMIEKTGFLLKDQETDILLVPDELFLSSFCRSLGIGKLPKTKNDDNTILRDIYLAERMSVETGPIMISSRRICRDTYCAIGVFKDFYRPKSEKDNEILKRLLTGYAKHPVRMESFIFLSERNSINYRIEDNENSEFSCGIQFSFSDTGDESYRITPILYRHSVSIPLTDYAVFQPHNRGYSIQKLFGQACSYLPKAEELLLTLRHMEEKPMQYSVPDGEKELRKLLNEVHFPIIYSAKKYKVLSEKFGDLAGNCMTIEVIRKLFEIRSNLQCKRTMEPKVLSALGKTLLHAADYIGTD